MLLITRPEPDGAETAVALKELGFDSLVEPMMHIENKSGVTINPEGVQAYLVTSANGARALAAATDQRHIKVFAVGSATAKTLRELGFVALSMAGGDVQSLAGQVIKACDPAAGPLVHIAASQQAGDLSGLLKVAGFECRKEVLYSAVAATQLSPILIEKLEKHEISSVLFYSPRTAAIFTGLVEGAAVGDWLKPVTALCLSRGVAGKLDKAKWRSIRVAARPEQDALFALLSQPETAPELSSAGTDQSMTSESLAGETYVPKDKSEQSETAVPILDKPVGPETKTSAPASGKKSSFGLLATLFIIVFFMGMAVWPLFYPKVQHYLPSYVSDFIPVPAGSVGDDGLKAIQVENTALKQQIAALESQMAEIKTDLEARIDALASSGQPGAATDIQMLAIGEKIRMLGSEISAVQEDVTARLDHQSDQLAQLAARPATAPSDGSAPAMPEISAALDQVKAQVAALADSLADTTMQLDARTQGAQDSILEQAARLQSMEAKLQSMPKSTAGGESAAMVLGLGRLRADIEAGEAYADSLALFRISVDPSIQAPVAALSEYAQTGIAPMARLSQDFTQLADDLVHASRLPDDESWIGKTLSTIAGSIKFRKTGDAAGSDTGAIVARAEVRLKADDLAGAVRELAKLEGKPASMAADWMRSARARLAVEAALAQLNGIVTDLALQSLQQAE